MPKVLNKRKDGLPKDAVYIGRGGPFGNPFVIGRDGNRAEVIAKYRQMIERDPALKDRVIRELNGKDLVCWCAPQACHGDVLLEIANK